MGTIVRAGYKRALDWYTRSALGHDGIDRWLRGTIGINGPPMIATVIRSMFQVPMGRRVSLRTQGSACVKAPMMRAFLPSMLNRNPRATVRLNLKVVPRYPRGSHARISLRGSSPMPSSRFLRRLSRRRPMGALPMDRCLRSNPLNRPHLLILHTSPARTSRHYTVRLPRDGRLSLKSRPMHPSNRLRPIVVPKQWAAMVLVPIVPCRHLPPTPMRLVAELLLRRRRCPMPIPPTMHAGPIRYLWCLSA